MKKFLLIMLTFVLCTYGVSFAQTRDVTVLLNKNILIEYNGEMKEFQNVNGVRVYPISYEGTTYLPIRSISSLLNSKIRWDGASNSIFLNDGDLDLDNEVWYCSESIFKWRY